MSATHAALLLAQGAGRLLRGMDDRGVVAVLDPRLATARYGGFLRASLPPFWPTEDRETVRAALRRLQGGGREPSHSGARRDAGDRPGDHLGEPRVAHRDGRVALDRGAQPRPALTVGGPDRERRAPR